MAGRKNTDFKRSAAQPEGKLTENGRHEKMRAILGG
jgi:hypothetical protein